MTHPRLAILGVTGRMGQSLLRALKDDGGFTLSGALASPASPRLGLDAAAEGPETGVRVTADLSQALAGAAVAVDFSSGNAVAAHAAACAAAGVPLLVGTTGLAAPAGQALESAARRIPLLVAPNTSVGVGVLLELARVAAAALGPGFDVEIFEAHHRLKRDAPSGTALALGEAVAAVRGQVFEDVAVLGRSGVGAPRAPGSIGFAAVRGGDIVGEHTVIFAGHGERVEITHRATDRQIFARGALKAAAWLIAKPAGLYGIEDMLGI